MELQTYNFALYQFKSFCSLASIPGLALHMHASITVQTVYVHTFQHRKEVHSIELADTLGNSLHLVLYEGKLPLVKALRGSGWIVEFHY